MTINHLKNRDAQRKTLAVAFGRHAVKGHLCWSRVEGGPGSFNMIAYNALGEGEWDSCEAAYYRGIEVPPLDYNFHPGALAAGMEEVDAYFERDVPHSRTAAIGYKCPLNIGDTDTEKNPPDAFEGIFRTKKVPDFDPSGNQTDLSYSANPARCIAGALTSYGRLPNLPLVYMDELDYWRTRIDWAAWRDWRDYCDQLETVDYTDFGDADGFGLTASYYNGPGDFEHFVTSFVQPVIDINPGVASPVAGVDANGFTARFEGTLKAKASGNFTFHITRDDGARLYIDGHPLIDEWVFGVGSGTASYELVEGHTYPIVVEWSDSGGGAAQIKLEWDLKGVVPLEVIPSKYLYPRVEDRPKYESHIYFNSPANFADALRTILFVSNSVMQDVNGKLRFFCLEQLAPSFTLDNSKIDSFRFRRRDILQSDAVTSYEAKFRDLDSQFLEQPVTPIHIEVDYLSRKNNENVKVIDLFNTTRWQARKVLRMRAKLETGNDLMAEVEAKMARTYPVTAGDLITVAHRKVGPVPRTYLVREATDNAVAEASGSQGEEPEKRKFTLQEWTS
jgi:PA14 domain